jgi:ParB-like chromosome segregation protein Spo0J
MATMKTLVALATKSIVRIADPAHPLFDVRSKREIDPYTLADYRERGQQTPIAVISRENAERIGAAFEGGDYAIIYGNGRHMACEAVGIEYMTAFVEEIDSLASFLTMKMRENSIRDEETLDQLVTKAKLVADALIASGASLDDVAENASISLRKPTTTVRELLKLSDPTKTAEPVREMVKSGEIDLGSAKQITSAPVEQQIEIVAELAKVQSDALAAAIDSGKLAKAAESGEAVRVKTADGETATVTVKADGTATVKPSQDTVQKAKAKVQKKAAPESVKSEAARKAVAIDAAMIGAHKAKFAMLRRLPACDESLVLGAEMLAAMLTGTEYTLPENASESVKAAHAFLFAKK